MKQLVSVIVTTYRRDEYLKRALESLASQTITNFDIILVDDNDESSWNDKVQSIADEFKKKYPQIPLIYIQNHPNLGSAESRNTGVRSSCGDYVTFLDDDDLYLPDKLRNQCEFMISGELDFSITELALYYDDGKYCEYRKRDYLNKNDPESLLQYHMMYHMTGTDTMMFRKSYFESIGGFAPIDVGDEFYLMERAIRGRGKFSCLNCCDVKAFVHRTDAGLSSGQSKIDGENNLFEYKKQFFDEFDRKSVRYIKMRHHAVLAFAYLRNKQRKRFLKESIMSFATDPVCCIKLFFGMVK